jgi:hypothetical protein
MSTRLQKEIKNVTGSALHWSVLHTAVLFPKICSTFRTSNVPGLISLLLITKRGRAMAQAVSRRPLAAEARVQSWISPWGICGGQSGIGTGFTPEYFGFPPSISFHRCSITWKNEKRI